MSTPSTFGPNIALQLLLNIAAALVLVSAGPAGLTFTDIGAPGNRYGIDYRYGDDDAVDTERYINMGPQPQHMFSIPNGTPGVLIFDYDNDGDLDIYVVADDGVPNKLYENLLKENGSIRFIEVGQQAGVQATNQESRGVCSSDIDNDGDLDLYVNGKLDENILFRNEGDGTFTDISEASGFFRASGVFSNTCTFGDVNMDGLPDLYVGNAGTSQTMGSACDPPFADNILLINKGPGRFYNGDYATVFEDEAKARGVHKNHATTLGSGLVDYDQDGDLDLIIADDNCLRRDEIGFIRIYQNDRGTGHFLDATHTHGTDTPGAYMGLSFADLDYDGTIDVVTTDFGPWGQGINQNFTRGINDFRYTLNSRWLFNDEMGRLHEADIGAIRYTPFGWGCAAFDVDNNGTTDILFHGGNLNLPYFLADNPGVMLLNNGEGLFEYDPDASSDTDHRLRYVVGLAVGDLNDDGFNDIVSVSTQNYEYSVLFNDEFDSHDAKLPFGSLLDDVVGFVPHLINVGDGTYIYNDMERIWGTLSVELSSGDNGNNWIKVQAFGSFGIADGAITPRDGIGAIIKVTPDGSSLTQMIPVIGGGDSTNSMSAMQKVFGLGDAESATVEVQWPGAVFNRFYGIETGETLLVHEIPCDFKVKWDTFSDFTKCVNSALESLVDAKLVNRQDRDKLEQDQRKAYAETHSDLVSPSPPSHNKPSPMSVEVSSTHEPSPLPPQPVHTPSVVEEESVEASSETNEPVSPESPSPTRRPPSTEQQHDQDYCPIRIEGRRGANSVINDFYILLDNLHDGRPSYFSDEDDVYLYYHGVNVRWYLSNKLGSIDVYAKAVQQALTPADITTAWEVWDGTQFVKDDNVRAFCDDARHPFSDDLDSDTDSSIFNDVRGELSQGDGCPRSTVMLDGECYFVESKSLADWYTANENCALIPGGHLATVGSETTFKALLDIPVVGEFWFGYFGDEDSWHWLGPQPESDYQMWAEDEPDNNFEMNCAVYHNVPADTNKHRRWSDRNCEEILGYACAFPSNSVMRFEFTATQDSFILPDEDFQNKNEGANPYLQLSSTSVLISFSYSIPAEIIMAELVLHVVPDSARNWAKFGEDVSVSPLLTDWQEGNGRISGLDDKERGDGFGVTYMCGVDTDISNNNPDCDIYWDGGRKGFESSSCIHHNSTNDIVFWDVSFDVQHEQSSWIIERQEQSAGLIQYYSKESDDVKLAPKLEVWVTTGPSDTMLLLWLPNLWIWIFLFCFVYLLKSVSLSTFAFLGKWDFAVRNIDGGVFCKHLIDKFPRIWIIFYAVYSWIISAFCWTWKCGVCTILLNPWRSLWKKCRTCGRQKHHICEHKKVNGDCDANQVVKCENKEGFG